MKSPCLGLGAEVLGALLLTGAPFSPGQVLSGLCQADAAEGGRELDQLHPEENHFQRSAVRCGAAPPLPTLGRSALLTVPRHSLPGAPGSPLWGPPLRGPRCSPAPRGPRGSPHLLLPTAGSPRPNRPLALSARLPAPRGKACAGPNKELFNFLFYLTPASAALFRAPRAGRAVLYAFRGSLVSEGIRRANSPAREEAMPCCQATVRSFYVTSSAPVLHPGQRGDWVVATPWSRARSGR